MTVLVLVRHGEPTSYRDGGLTPQGRIDAESAAQRVRTLVDGECEVTVMTSPARRCRETARIVVESLRNVGREVPGAVLLPQLSMVRARIGKELVDVGLARDRATCGEPVADDLASFWNDHGAGVDPFVKWQAERYASFESPADVEARVFECLDDLPRPSVVVTHSELIKLVLRSLGAGDRPLPFGEVVVVGTIAPEATR